MFKRSGSTFDAIALLAAHAAKLSLIKYADLNSGIELQPHQARVVRNVQNQLATEDKVRLLLYQGLGSGKTLGGLAAAESTKIPYTAIVPAALRVNLRKEQEKFIDPATAVLSNIMSHTGLGRGLNIENPQSLLIDEAHRFRNSESAQTKNLLEAVRKAKQVVMLTGTPIVNSPADFAVPYSVLTGKNMSPEEFSSRYVDNDPHPSLYRRIFGLKAPDPALKNVNELKENLKGKVDYFAPAKPQAEINREDVITEMTRDQTDLNAQMYGKLPALLRWKLQLNYPLTNEESKKMVSFLTGPRQLGLSTNAFTQGKVDPMAAFKSSPKLTEAFKRLNDLLNKDPKGKALIFSNFIESGLAPYQAALNKAGIPAASFTGALSDKQRKKLVDDYNSDKLKVMLLGPSGTEGLSFKGTKLVQLLDPHWNNTRAEQSEGRGLRYDSHAHLPLADRKVKIERHIARAAPSRLKSLLRYIGIKVNSLPATDDYLIAAGNRKQQLNDKFLDLLKSASGNRRKMD